MTALQLVKDADKFGEKRIDLFCMWASNYGYRAVREDDLAPGAELLIMDVIDCLRTRNLGLPFHMCKSTIVATLPQACTADGYLQYHKETSLGSSCARVALKEVLIGRELFSNEETFIRWMIKK